MRRPELAGHHMLGVSQGRSDGHDLKSSSASIRSQWGADEYFAILDIMLLILLQLNLLESLSFILTVME